MRKVGKTLKAGLKVTHSLLSTFGLLCQMPGIPVGKSDVKKLFGAAVRQRRGHLGISQEELAGRAGLHRTYISDVERGARNVSLESIHRLAAALEVPMSQLFAWQHAESDLDRHNARVALLSDE
jgi:DNA-binding XRE family transcriptional regulator